MKILLVEDNPGDVRLMKEALHEGRLENELSVVDNGEDAISFLHRTGKYSQAQRPDLIFLDLNLPKKDGREVLADIKKDELLRRIPVVVLTTSEAEKDIFKAYDLHANCYVKKPVDLESFLTVVRACENFWLMIARLPER